MKIKNPECWKGVRLMGKWRFVFIVCCTFYCPASVIITLLDLWPDGKFFSFGNFLTKAIILLIGGFFIALLSWNSNEKSFGKQLI